MIESLAEKIVICRLCNVSNVLSVFNDLNTFSFKNILNDKFDISYSMPEIIKIERSGFISNVLTCHLWYLQLQNFQKFSI